MLRAAHLGRFMSTLRGTAGDARPVILGIETTFDDTGIGIVDADGNTLGEAVSTSRGLNSEYGGTVPSLAAEAHRVRFRGVLSSALDDAGMTMGDVDAVAVAVGPGLQACLRVGGDLANGLAAGHNLPLIPVHHLEAHVLTARMTEARNGRSLRFPYLALLVTGGNTQIVLAEGYGEYTLLGVTLDDAIGEAFDKSARTLGLDLGQTSGGAGMEALARDAHDGHGVRFSVPMRAHPGMDFSFSGLKTALATSAARLAADGRPPAELDHHTKAAVADAFQTAAFAHVIDKTSRAVDHALRTLAPSEDNPLPLVVCGGVSANSALRSSLDALQAHHKDILDVIFTPLPLCTDNGVMIAWAGHEALNHGLAPVPSVVTNPKLPWVTSSLSSAPKAGNMVKPPPTPITL